MSESNNEVYERMYDALAHIARIRVDLSQALDAEALFVHLNDAVKTARKGLELPGSVEEPPDRERYSFNANATPANIKTQA